MAYLDENKIPQVPKEQQIHNNQIGELMQKLESIQHELIYCANLNDDLKNDDLFQKMILECHLLIERCSERSSMYLIF